DKGEIIELLQQEVRGVVVDRAALVAAELVQKHLEGGAVEEILARVQLVADVDAMVLIDVQDRLPAAGELGEGLVDQPVRTLRPRIKIGEGERAGEGDADIKPQISRGFCRVLNL